jgi:energy-coupling factor transporter transmembrane protein EcfT
MWPGVKLIALLLLALGFSVRPVFGAEAILVAVVGVAFVISRVPIGAVPRLPRWFWIGLAIAGIGALFAGGPPDVHVRDLAIGMDGVLQWIKFSVFALAVAFAAALVGWTTPLAELAPALRLLLTPLRVVRVPVDELVTAISLSVRCLPLLFEDVRILQAARRVRQSVAPKGWKARVVDVHDLLVTALVSSVRRAGEMAEAMDARGGPGPIARTRPRFHVVDAVAGAVLAGALVGMLLV